MGARHVHIVEAARAAGMTRLSLETGSWPFFEAARALYRTHGFADCLPFGDYVADPNSVFMTRPTTLPPITQPAVPELDRWPSPAAREDSWRARRRRSAARRRPRMSRGRAR